MSVIEKISRMSKVGCSDKELLGYIYDNKRSRDHSLDTVWGLRTMKMKG